MPASQPAIGHRLSACTEGGGSLCAELPRPLYARGGRRKKWPILGGWIILRAAKRPRGNALVVPSPSSRNKYWPMSRSLAPTPIAIILSRTNDISTGGGALPSFFLSGFGLGGLPIPIRIPLLLQALSSSPLPSLHHPSPSSPELIDPLPPPLVLLICRLAPRRLRTHRPRPPPPYLAPIWRRVWRRRQRRREEIVSGKWRVSERMGRGGEECTL